MLSVGAGVLGLLLVARAASSPRDPEPPAGWPAALRSLLRGSPVRYHMYDPLLFDFNVRFPTQHRYSLQYSADVLVLRDLLAAQPGGAPAGALATLAASAPGVSPPGERVAPELAHVFIVPVAGSVCITDDAPCSEPGVVDRAAALRASWDQMLAQLAHLKPRVRDHLLLCSDWRCVSALKTLRPLPFGLAVGYWMGEEGRTDGEFEDAAQASARARVPPRRSRPPGDYDGPGPPHRHI